MPRPLEFGSSLLDPMKGWKRKSESLLVGSFDP